MVAVSQKPSLLKKVWEAVLVIIVLNITAFLVSTAVSFAIGAWASQYCSGWNEGPGQSTCTIEGIAGYADDFYGLMTIASFTIGIPFFILAGLCYVTGLYWLRLGRKWKETHSILRIVSLVLVGLSGIAAFIFLAPVAVIAYWILGALFWE